MRAWSGQVRQKGSETKHARACFDGEKGEFCLRRDNLKVPCGNYKYKPEALSRLH